MKCVDCPYFWKEENDEFACCHYRWNDGYAPCEVEDHYEEPYDEDSYEEDFYEEEVDPT